MALMPLPTTQARIAALPTPDSGAVEYQHPRLRSLRLRITSGGARSWDLYKRIGGRQTRHTIGRWPDVPLADAERIAQKLLVSIADGTYQPKAVTRARGQTLQEAFEGYLAFRSTGPRPLKASTVDSYRSAMKASFGDWMAIPVSQITGSAVQQRHSLRSASTTSRADGDARVLRAVLRWAAGEADQPIDNVATAKLRHRWNGPKRRTDRLQPNELKKFFVAAQEHGQAGRALQLLLLVGLRRNELLRLPRSAVDLVAGTLVVAKNKASRPFTVPLSAPALAVVKAQIHQDIGPWLFSSPNDPKKPLKHIDRAFAALKTAVGADVDLQIHGLRRTFASIASQFCGSYVLKRLLNHAIDQSDVSDGYVSTDVETLRQVAEKVAQFVLEDRG